MSKKQPIIQPSKEQLTKEFKIIKKIVQEYFNTDFSAFNKRDNIIGFPAGTITYEEDNNHWALSTDYEWLLHYDLLEKESEQINKMQYYFDFISKLSKLISSLEIYEGYYSVFTDKNICAGSLWLSNIEKYMKENKMEFEVAKNILYQKMILEYEEEIKGENS